MTAPEMVPRPPGWVYVSTRDGVIGWHRVRQVGVYGAVETACGATGRPIKENQRRIVLCPECAAASENWAFTKPLSAI